VSGRNDDNDLDSHLMHLSIFRDGLQPLERMKLTPAGGNVNSAECRA